jgi:hypothetical protein
MVIIMAVVLLVVTVVTSVIIKNSTQDMAQDRNVLREEQTDVAINAILQSTVNQTSTSLSKLIGQSIYEVNTQIVVNSETIDITNTTKDYFDLVFGEDKYYLTIDPVVQGVSLMFVIDSSSTVQSERETIAAELEYIRNETKSIIKTSGEETLFITIFLLPTNGDSDCTLFDNLALPDTTCIQLDSVTLYNELLDIGWQRPGFGIGTFEQWASTSPFATPVHFSGSDWAAGVANAALFYNNSFFLQTATNLNLIFPLSDELSTSSKADFCFQLDDFGEFVACNLCNAACPVNRALQGIEQAIPIVQSSKSVVFPIYSVNCDFRYTAGWNEFSSNANLEVYLDPPKTPLDQNDFPGDSWCHQDACGACEPAPNYNTNNPLMCIYESCAPVLLDQMEVLASATDGQVFNIVNANEIPENIITAFDDTINQYNFTIGEQRNDTDRFVFEKVIPLTESLRGRLQIWVYS